MKERGEETEERGEIGEAANKGQSFLVVEGKGAVSPALLRAYLREGKGGGGGRE